MKKFLIMLTILLSVNICYGASMFKDLYVTGLSTFEKDVYMRGILTITPTNSASTINGININVGNGTDVNRGTYTLVTGGSLANIGHEVSITGTSFASAGFHVGDSSTLNSDSIKGYSASISGASPMNYGSYYDVYGPSFIYNTGSWVKVDKSIGNNIGYASEVYNHDYPNNDMICYWSLGSGISGGNGNVYGFVGNNETAGDGNIYDFYAGSTIVGGTGTNYAFYAANGYSRFLDTEISGDLTVTGVSTATAYWGDGSHLTGLPAGTAIGSSGATPLTGIVTLDAVGAGIKITQTGQRISFEVNTTGGGGLTSISSLGASALTGEVNISAINGYVTQANDTITVEVYSGFAEPIPIGSMTMFAGASAPLGWLICDGSDVSRSVYANLYSVIGTAYGSGDASTTFNLPDARASCPAGVGTSYGYTENETVEIGTKYDDSFQGHGHAILYYTGHDNGGSGISCTDGPSVTSNRVLQPETYGSYGTPRAANVTKGKTFGVNFIIKY